MRRRSFLAWILGFASVLAAKLAAVRSWPDRALASAPRPTPADAALGFFTSEQAVTMQALVERLLPSNVPAGTPGAKETRVLRYLDRQLGTPRFPQYRDVVRDGLAALDDIARAKSSNRFHELPAGEQDEILRRVQRGDTQERPPASVRFFQVVLTLSLEGHWGHPRYGGNYDELTWRSVGIDPGCEGGGRARRGAQRP
jgi:gluconate 2-dehydrogenase gamma chain